MGIGRDSGKRAPRVGPYSTRAVLMALDRRTRESALARSTHAELVAHVGGHPTPPQALIIQLVVLRTLRIALLVNRLGVGELTEHDDRTLNAWMNSMRSDLLALGIRAPEKSVPSLEAYLVTREKDLAA
jgi:hypothetical protein